MRLIVTLAKTRNLCDRANVSIKLVCLASREITGILDRLAASLQPATFCLFKIGFPASGPLLALSVRTHNHPIISVLFYVVLFDVSGLYGKIPCCRSCSICKCDSRITPSLSLGSIVPVWPLAMLLPACCRTRDGRTVGILDAIVTALMWSES